MLTLIYRPAVGVLIGLFLVWAWVRLGAWLLLPALPAIYASLYAAFGRDDPSTAWAKRRGLA